jgi:hypothetical protein
MSILFELYYSKYSTFAPLSSLDGIGPWKTR